MGEESTAARTGEWVASGQGWTRTQPLAGASPSIAGTTPTCWLV
ncbi:MAG: hypothetical protein ACOY5R_22420 [Pseudomonadota bacterium]